MVFVCEIAQALIVLEKIPGSDAASPEFSLEGMQVCNRISCGIHVTISDRHEFSDRFSMLGNQESFTLLNPFQQFREMSFRFVGAQLLHQTESAKQTSRRLVEFADSVNLLMALPVRTRLIRCNLTNNTIDLTGYRYAAPGGSLWALCATQRGSKSQMLDEGNEVLIGKQQWMLLIYTEGSD